MLSPIYEGQFSDNSFGFRPHRSCHKALSIDIQQIMRAILKKLPKYCYINADKFCFIKNGLHITFFVKKSLFLLDIVT
nr:MULTISPECIES: hypothetical protein [unclassified Proteiniphilum]